MSVPVSARFHQKQRPRTLIDTLCDSNRHKVRRLTAVEQVFPQFVFQPNFHCSSFFRRSQLPSAHEFSFYDSRQPFTFQDGRTYEIIDFQISAETKKEIRYRVCVDVIEASSSEFLPFEVWFYNSYFAEDPVVSEQTAKDHEFHMIHFARQWIWEFLYAKRNAVDWSRYGHPYVCEFR